ncbi:DUF1697 domain-containing protein [soil metagenome]
MQKYIAFLRAINVGGHTVKMEVLRGLFEALELTNVETFIASGNVIFEATDQSPRALESQIEAALHDALGYKVATFIRTPAELAEIAQIKLFDAATLAAEGNMLYIGFVAEPPSHAAQQKLLTFNNDVDEFHVHAREIYWLCRRKFSESTFSGARLEKTLALQTTLRNVTTVKKLAARYTP